MAACPSAVRGAAPPLASSQRSGVVRLPLCPHLRQHLKRLAAARCREQAIGELGRVLGAQRAVRHERHERAGASLVGGVHGLEEQVDRAVGIDARETREHVRDDARRRRAQALRPRERGIGIRAAVARRDRRSASGRARFPAAAPRRMRSAASGSSRARLMSAGAPHHRAELARHAFGRLQRALWVDERERLQRARSATLRRAARRRDRARSRRARRDRCAPTRA